MTTPLPVRGFGLGLRPEHYAAFRPDTRAARPHVDWLEIISENFMVPGGRPLAHLDAIRADFPLVMHGVSMSIGSADPLDEAYLRDLRALADRVQPAWISDHLCWTGVDHANLHDLLPMPYTEAALRHLAPRIARVQDLLQRRLVIENVSSYVAFAGDEMAEHEFVAELLRRADCELLLDVNNVYVSSRNHGFDPRRYLAAIPAARVREIHLAGHSVKHYDEGDILIDTHNAPVCADVWALYRDAIARLGPVPTLIEWDSDLPPLATLVEEATRAETILEACHDAVPA